MPRELIVIMGPSGCGKSHISQELAAHMNVPMVEGDNHHPPSNLKKMASGQPLSDDDRVLWMDRLIEALQACKSDRVILACSALTKYVQDRLADAPIRKVHFILLQAPREVLEQRMEARSDHFMPVSLLDSQLDALNAPADAIVIDARETAETIVMHISAALEDKA